VAVFLQKRDKGIGILAGMFSFFGDRMEAGETPEQALVREIKEELNYDLRSYQFLGEYESFLGPSHMLHMYYAQVKDNFEREVTVLEGEYGKFLTESEAAQEPLLIENDKKILRDFFQRLKNNVVL
ncbi:MAG: NUDIX domain-containing protein, partial [Candidatus Saccharimonadales bacterium]